jgi:hypothetical protein
VKRRPDHARQVHSSRYKGLHFTIPLFCTATGLPLPVRSLAVASASLATLLGFIYREESPRRDGMIINVTTAGSLVYYS